MLLARAPRIATTTARRARTLAPRRSAVRALASYRPPDDNKSWGDIADDAARVAKGALKKLGVGALDAVAGLLKKTTGDASPPRESSRRSQRPPDAGTWGGSGGWGVARDDDRDRRGGGLAGGGTAGPLGGPLGGLLGGLLGQVAKAGLEGLASAGRDAAALQADALAALAADPAVARAFGGRVVALPGPSSQSSSTAIINGQRTRVISVSFGVTGPAGSGLAQASAREGTGPRAVQVRVRTPRGGVIDVAGGGGGGGGGGDGVIDVDWREV